MQVNINTKVRRQLRRLGHAIIHYYEVTMNFLNSDWHSRLIASTYRTTCPPRNFAREVNKSHVAVSTYPNIVTGENQ